MGTIWDFILNLFAVFRAITLFQLFLFKDRVPYYILFILDILGNTWKLEVLENSTLITLGLSFTILVPKNGDAMGKMGSVDDDMATGSRVWNSYKNKKTFLKAGDHMKTDWHWMKDFWFTIICNFFLNVFSCPRVNQQPVFG